jgi:cytochrome b561
MIVIHWLMAAIVASAAISAFVIDEMPNATAKASMTNLHFVFGSLALALVVVRVLVRLTTPVPALPADTPIRMWPKPHWSAIWVSMR